MIAAALIMVGIGVAIGLFLGVPIGRRIEWRHNANETHRRVASELGHPITHDVHAAPWWERIFTWND